MTFRYLMAFAVIGFGHAAAAGTLEDLRASLTGTEIGITGHIGTGLDLMDKEALAFRDSAGHVYPVIFDAGREARKALDGCVFARFGGGSPCAMQGMAEVELDGSRIRLIVYEVATFSDPAPLN